MIIDEVQKIYADGKEALKGVSMELYTDQIFSLLGHNGAGKTTLISIISGLLPKAKGKVTLFGIDIDLDRKEAKRLIGVCP